MSPNSMQLNFTGLLPPVQTHWFLSNRFSRNCVVLHRHPLDAFYPAFELPPVTSWAAGPLGLKLSPPPPYTCTHTHIHTHTHTHTHTLYWCELHIWINTTYTAAGELREGEVREGEMREGEMRGRLGNHIKQLNHGLKVNFLLYLVKSSCLKLWKYSWMHKRRPSACN